jgi:hypothetical protein
MKEQDSILIKMFLIMEVEGIVRRKTVAILLVYGQKLERIVLVQPPIQDPDWSLDQSTFEKLIL